MDALDKNRLTCRPKGFHMIEKGHIKNFRCFKDVSFPKCRRVNIVVGENAAGKTALLEALFLTLGTGPELAARVRKWRGYDLTFTGTFEEIDKAMWADFFFKFDLGKKIEIKLEGTGQHKRGLSIRFSGGQTFVPVEEGGKGAGPEYVEGESAAEFTWYTPEGKRPPIRPVFKGGSYEFARVLPVVDASYYAPVNPLSNSEAVKRFSNLSSRRKEAPVVKAIKKEFPFITGIEILSFVGVSMLYADIPYLPEKIPLAGISLGVNKLMSLMLALAEPEKPVVIIDEIENGFHYSKMESVWGTLYDLCKENDAQIFASTHSYECLEALAKIAEKNPDDFSLIRVERDKETGTADIKQFVGLKAIPFGEVR